MKWELELNSVSQKLCRGYMCAIGLKCSAILSQKVFSLKSPELNNYYKKLEECFKNSPSLASSTNSETSGYSYSDSLPDNVEAVQDMWQHMKSYFSIATHMHDANKYWEKAESRIEQFGLESFFAKINTHISKLELSSDVLHLAKYIMIVLAEVNGIYSKNGILRN